MAQSAIDPEMLVAVGIEEEIAKTYADKFEKESVNRSNMSLLDKDTLEELGVEKIGHRLAILKMIKNIEVRDNSSSNGVKIPPAKVPHLSSDMTQQQFRKFCTDWDVYCRITNLPKEQYNLQLYNNADEEAQIALVNTYPDFFLINAAELLSKIELVVTQRVHPMVHRVDFSKLTQGSNETIQNFVVRLRAAAKDCDYSCPHCLRDISDNYIKDKFICGVYNNVLQADILSKAETLTNMEDIIKHAECFETALRDQSKLVNQDEAAMARVSAYKNGKKYDKTLQSKSYVPKRPPQSDKQPRPQPHDRGPRPQQKDRCAGCGRFHARPFRRDEVCPAWGQTCFKCGRLNHFSQVCKNDQKGTAYNFKSDNSDSEAEMSALVAHVAFDADGNLFNIKEKDILEIPAEVVPFSIKDSPFSFENFKKKKVNIFPDSGASICLGGTKHLNQLGLTKQNLIPCNKTVTAVGNHKMNCLGWVPMEFCVNGNVTKQALYICERVERLYFSKAACKDVGILPKCFPNPPAREALEEFQDGIEQGEHSIAKLSINPNNKHYSNNSKNVNKNKRFQTQSIKHENLVNNSMSDQNPKLNGNKAAHLPIRPEKLPFPALKENIPRLKQWLLDSFKDTAFCKTNDNGKFPTLVGPPAHIHLKEGAIPRARHNPIPVPFHMKDAVKRALDDDVKRGILQKVPVGTPTEWCSTMVITPKKDGRPRRTIDYQYLNKQCLRETHHQGSPFYLAMQVPAGSYKSILDAVDGYHSVQLDLESQPITTFITEWGRYMYIRMPQGFLASGDAYTSRYDQIIIDVQQKVKIVDDVLLYDSDIEEAFYHTFDFLSLGYQNGIVFNVSKFVFCELEVEFAGLRLTAEGVAPAKSMLAAIIDFPTPTNLTDARSWFGLVNQVAWAYSVGPVMQPFRELLKSKCGFSWTQSLENAFSESKKILVQLVEQGVSTFDVNRVTCLAPDWSKQGMGFLLLQKYCSCDLAKAPICCNDGWHLIFAGSRYCNDAESRYAPIEGEASAIAWALQKCRMFVMGCNNLIVVTDHAPLLGIFGDRDLSKITNPRLFKLKEKTMLFRFSIQHCPGKWHRGSDALSRNVPSAARALFEVCAVQPSTLDNEIASEVESCMQSAAAEAVSDYGDDVGVISLDMIKSSGREDEAYLLLADQIVKGFPTSKHSTHPLIREYWEVRQRLSMTNGLVMMDRRIVVPNSLRKRILRCLHSAHQGVVGMKARANETVYWPGMDSCIRNYRETCRTCVRIAPSQPREPIILAKSPDWPFQKIVMDLFFVEHHAYLACADRFTGWLMLFHLPPGKANAENLINICRNIFQAYGVPEEISRDGGPPMQSKKFLDFLDAWQVRHRISSAGYPQSNGRAELAVKSGKRIVYDNTAHNGSLNTDKTARAVLQYRNTPMQGIGLSPAQMLLHRQLRDCLPSHPELYKPHKDWITAGYQREQMLAKRNHRLIFDYNRNAHCLSPLLVGDEVMIQDQTNKKWDRSGVVVEVLPNRQYNVRMVGSGRISLRNRRFLKKVAGFNSSYSRLASSIRAYIQRH